MFNIFKKHTTKRSLFTEEEQLRISNAISRAEITTSGEIRVFVEHDCPLADPIERAMEVFNKLEMDKTELRNGILIYIALHCRKASIYGDQGIYEKVGSNDFWEEELQILIDHLKHGELIEGLEHIIADLGFQLGEYFPFIPGIDKNELPDEIVFGNELNDIEIQKD